MGFAGSNSQNTKSRSWVDSITTGESMTRLAIFLPRQRERCRLTITETTLPSVPSVIRSEHEVEVVGRFHHHRREHDAAGNLLAEAVGEMPAHHHGDDRAERAVGDPI